MHTKEEGLREKGSVKGEERNREEGRKGEELGLLNTLRVSWVLTIHACSVTEAGLTGLTLP